MMSPLNDAATAEAGTPNPIWRRIRPWWLLTLVALDYFILVLHRKLVFYVQIPLSEELSLSKTQVGILDTGFLIPYSLAQLFVSYLGDRYRRRSVLLCSLSASVVALAAMGFVQNFSQLLLLRIVLGFAQAASVPAIAGVLADCFTPKSRSTAIGIYNLSLNMGYIVAGKWGGAFADMDAGQFGSTELSGWRMSMLFFALAGALILLLLFFFLSEPERTGRDTSRGLGAEGGSLWATIKSVFSVRSYVVLTVVFLLFCIITNAHDAFLARYFVENLTMTNEEAGQFSTLWMRPASIVGLILGGLLADWWARHWRAGRLLVQLIGIVVWIPALYLVGTSSSTAVLAGSMVAIGLGMGFYIVNIWTSAFDVVDPAARSTAVGFFNVVGIGASPSATVVGYLSDTEILNFSQSLASLSLLAVAITVLILLTIVFLLPRDYRGPLADEEASADVS